MQGELRHLKSKWSSYSYILLPLVEWIVISFSVLDAAVVLVIGRFSGVVLFVPLGVVGVVLREEVTTKR